MSGSSGKGASPSGPLPRFRPAGRVDYPRVEAAKRPLFAAAYERFVAGRRGSLRRSFEEFCSEQSFWLDDYALFMALREAIGKPWTDWPADLALRRPAAIRKARADLRQAIDYRRFLQFIFARQFAALREHAQPTDLAHGRYGDVRGPRLL